jgi:hypothetical protein
MLMDGWDTLELSANLPAVESTGMSICGLNEAGELHQVF